MRSLAPITPEIFRIVILYDHLSSGRLAATAYSHLSRELQTDFALELRIWRFDVAISNDCVAYADSDIEIADMVILAARDSDSCVAAFKRWTEKPPIRPGQRKQALVAIAADDSKAPMATGTWSDALINAFEKIEVDVFLWPSAVFLGDSLPLLSDAALPGITP